MSNLKSRIPSLALAFSVAASGIALGIAANDHFNPPPAPMTTADVVKAVMPAVVKLDVTKSPDTPTEEKKGGMGSGFIIDGKNGYIITNNHVIDDSNKIIVNLANGKKYVGTLVGTDPLSDIAVVQIKPETGTILPQQSFADSNKLQLGDPVIAIGSPFGLKDSVSTGVVSALNRQAGNPVQNLIQNDAPVNPGNSGGPLFNKDGKVIGMNNEIFTTSGQSAGISFAIPSNMVKIVANELIAHKKMNWGYLGVQLRRTKDGPNVSKVDPDEPLNIVIDKVTPGGAAEKAGLKEKDIVVSVNNTAIKDTFDFTSRVISMRAGTKVDIGYIRDNVPGHATVTLGEWPKEALKDHDNEESDNSPSPGPEGSPKFHFGQPHP